MLKLHSIEAVQKPPPYDPHEVGKRIRLVRVAHKLSQADLGAILGVKPGHVGNWENGTARPRIDIAYRLSDRFGLSLDWIFLGRRETLRFETAQLLADTEAALGPDHQG